MSKRRWRGRATEGGPAGSEEEEEEGPSRQQARVSTAAGKRAPRRGRLQLSQSTAGSGGSAGNALAVLLAGSRAAAAANGASGGTAAAESSGAAPKSYPRRGARVLKHSDAAPDAAAAGGSSQQSAAAAQTAQAAAVTIEPGGGAAAAAAPAAAAIGGKGELWVEQHAPASEAELVVHKKKVAEVRQWLEEQRASLGRPGVPRLLVVTGPPGCGKSTVLTTLARSLGFDVSEWRAPNAVQWEEASYASMQYRSKLDDFGEFVARSKMPHLSLQASSTSDSTRSSGGSRPSSAAPASQQGTAPAASAAMQATQAAAAAGAALPRSRLPPLLLPTLVLVDDLPHAAGPEQRRQIAEALSDLAAGARFPVAVVATEMSGKAQQEKGLSAAAGTFQGLHKELVAVLEAHRATTISFNPLTPTMIAKALRGILERQRRVLPEADVLAIAEQSQGDLFNAISTLQFVCTGMAPAPAAAKAAPKARGRGAKRKADAGSGAGKAAAAAEGAAAEARVGYAVRDSTLSLFHALGKLLYNKRLEPGSSQQQAQQAAQQQQQQQQQQEPPWASFGRAAAAAPAKPLPLAGWAQRRPMEFDPEAVLAGAGLEAGSVAAFLHENVLHFIDDSAVEDAAACLEQLSAADCLASGRRWGTGDAMMGDEDSPSATLLDALAASTAARGVCFANAHPAPRRWLPLKAPSVFAAARGAAANRAELCQHTSAAWALAGGMRSLEMAGRLAAELLPFARAIAACCPAPAPLQRLQPARWSRFWGGQLYEQPGGAGGGGGAQGEGEQGGSGGEAAAAADDSIEESEDEDDCSSCEGRVKRATDLLSDETNV
ncbi:hypothetical protein ABPG75_008758 [Micractinium tetrahymenae]